jgi:hypothetical protein
VDVLLLVLDPLQLRLNVVLDLLVVVLLNVGLLRSKL